MEVQCFEIKTEADSNDSSLCSDDAKPSTGMFTVSDSRGLVVTSGALPEPSSQFALMFLPLTLLISINDMFHL